MHRPGPLGLGQGQWDLKDQDHIIKNRIKSINNISVIIPKCYLIYYCIFNKLSIFLIFSAGVFFSRHSMI